MHYILTFICEMLVFTDEIQSLYNASLSSKPNKIHGNTLIHQ